MAEIAVVVVDTISSDFYQDCMCYKAGDIIEVLPDGWSWGVEDLRNPNWRILKFPGVPVTAFTQFTTPQIPTDPKNPSKTLLRRAVRFVYSALDSTNWASSHPAGVVTFKNFIADSTRQTQTLTVPTALTQELATMTFVKPLVADPTIIGVPQGNVF